MDVQELCTSVENEQAVLTSCHSVGDRDAGIAPAYQCPNYTNTKQRVILLPRQRNLYMEETGPIAEVCWRITSEEVISKGNSSPSRQIQNFLFLIDEQSCAFFCFLCSAVGHSLETSTCQSTC